MVKYKKVSVVIPTYKRESDLIRAVTSVLKQKYPSFELLVIDQTSKHESKTAKFLQGVKDNRFKYFKITPPSLPAARNFAINKASGEIIIYIDDDVELDSNFIDEHVKAYTDPIIGGVAGRVRGPTEKESQTLYRLTLSGKRVGSFNYPYDMEAMAARGCNMSFRAAVLRALGGFDTNYVGNAYREDTDMSFRVRKAGYKMLFRSKASLIHYDAVSGGCREQAMLFNDINAFSNNFRFFYKNQPKRYIISFYLTHITKIVPALNPVLSFKRLYYVFKGSSKARRQLKHDDPQLLPRELNT